MKNFLLFILLFAIDSLHASTLYWINGTGNWSDATHWSATSGGSSCTCIPATTDDVVFDVNSFTGAGQTVTVNALSYCANMTWTSGVNTPTIAGSNELDIYGSLTLSPNMNLTYNGSIYFKSNSGNSTITTAGKVIRSSLYFDGTGGAWTLQDSLVTYSGGTWIYLTQGSLNTNSQYIYAYAINAASSSPCSLTLGTSNIVLTVLSSTADAWSTSANLTLSAGSSNITLTGNGAEFAGGNFIYNNVTFTGTSGTATLISTATFNNVSCNSNAYIGGNNTFNNLTLATSATTNISNTQTINGTFTCSGTCAIPAILTGGTLSKASGNVSIDYVRLQNVIATGGATFTANNVTDFGGNTGWVLNTPTPQTLYWIGNSGNWTDATHWAATSGGSSSSCIPSKYDNVVFDANSFTGAGQTVTVNALSYCANMTWTSGVNTPTIAGSNELDIYGSLTLSPNMNLTYNGSIYFKSNSGNSTITTAGKVIRSSLYFDGTGGAWTLQDSLVTYSGGTWIYLTQGSLNTNSQYIYAYAINAASSSPCSLTLGTSNIVLTVLSSTADAWSTSANLTLSAGSSNITLTGNGAEFAGGNFIYNNVTFTGTSGTATLISTATFNNVSCNSNAYIGGNNTFNNLTLATSATTNISNTQTINGTFTCSGTCAIPAILTGGTLSKASGNVSIDYVRLQNVIATGGATFTANNVTDFGGNTGWVLNTPTPQTLYWIGNSGNWTDATHWAATSGGSSSSCIPSKYDNVVFDANSFTGAGQTVTVNALSYCANMTWTSGVNTPTIAGSNELDIYGSLTLSPNMNLTYNGSIYFKSNSGNSTITTAGKVIRSSLYFDGTGGAWTLQDSLVTYSGGTWIYLTQGSLNTNSQYIYAYAINAASSSPCSLTLGTSNIVLTVLSSTADAWSTSANLTLSAGSSNITLTGNGAEFAGGNFIYNNVTFTGTSGTATLISTATFNNVSCNSNAYIGGNNTFNNLTLATSATTNISNTQTINGTFTCNGTSGVHAVITGGTISKNSGTVCINYVNLTNSIASGGATFYAGNSQNLSGNTGWLFQSCSGGSIPVANFSATPQTGQATLNVSFTDLSTNVPTLWNWSFPGANTVSSVVQNPVIAYSSPGTYSVTLIATNTYGSDTIVKSGYITVTNSSGNAPVANFSATPQTGPTPLTVDFTDLSSNVPTSWNWSFPGANTTSSISQNPVIVYSTPGTYSVTLIATNSSGSNTKVQSGYIVVTNQSTAPQIAVTSPNGGESWLIGNSYTIAATITGSYNSIAIELSEDGGSTYPYLLYGYCSNNMTGNVNFNWPITNNYPGSSNCLIRITLTYGNGISVSDASNNTFSITNDTITGTAFSLNSSLSHLFWPYVDASTWPCTARNGFRGGWNDPATTCDGGPGSGHGMDGHNESDYFADDWNNILLGSCNREFHAPLSGTVIFEWNTCQYDNASCMSNSTTEAACDHGYGNQVIIQSDIDSTYAFRVAHLKESDVTLGQHVNVGDLLGIMGGTGHVTGPHAHCVLYRNISNYDANMGTTGISRLDQGNILNLSEQAPYYSDNYAGDFMFDAVIGGSGGGFVENPIQISGSVSFCQGDSTILTAPNGAYYFWNNGDTTASIVVKNQGSYNVIVIDSNNNTLYSQTITVSAIQPVVPEIYASSNSLCPGSALQISAFQNINDTASDVITEYDNYHFQWSNNDTAYFTTITTPGTYTVTVSNGLSCLGGVASITIQQGVSPNQPTIQANGNSLASSTASNCSYQWYLNGAPIGGATSQFYSTDTSGPGYYTVAVTNSSGCSNTSDPLFITGIEDLIQIQSINIYPNPNKGDFNITLKSESLKQVEINLLNILGQPVYSKPFDLINGELNTSLNVENIAKGLYLIQIKSEGESIYRKVTID